jgi:hypothetical protein
MGIKERQMNEAIDASLVGLRGLVGELRTSDQPIRANVLEEITNCLSGSRVADPSEADS